MTNFFKERKTLLGELASAGIRSLQEVRPPKIVQRAGDQPALPHFFRRCQALLKQRASMSQFSPEKCQDTLRHQSISDAHVVAQLFIQRETLRKHLIACFNIASIMFDITQYSQTGCNSSCIAQALKYLLAFF